MYPTRGARRLPFRNALPNRTAATTRMTTRRTSHQKRRSNGRWRTLTRLRVRPSDCAVDMTRFCRAIRGTLLFVCYNPYSMRLPRGLSRRSILQGLTAVAVACGLAASAAPEQKKKKEDVTQVLQLPKDL